MRRSLLGVGVVLFAVAGCGGDSGEREATGATGPDELPFGLVRCPADPESVEAPADHYRDEPVYVGNEMPVEEVRAWAAAKPGFEELWIDRDRNGWITVAFSEGADERQAELEVDFPDVGVVAVAVPWTNGELTELRDRAFDALRAAGIEAGGYHSVSTGLVSVMVGELSRDRLEPLAPLAGPRLCVQGVEPEDVTPGGSQPEGGEGWRLLGAARTGPVYRTGVATDPAQLERLWADSGIPGDPPPVDFEEEIAIWFGAVYGSGCEIRMDDVVVDRDRRLVHAELVVPGSPQACHSDANPQAYVVALDRTRLPAGPFAVQLDAEDPPPGAPEERTLVDADLRDPGSVARADQIGPDPALLDARDRPRPVMAGDILEPGYPRPYRLVLDCGFDVLGPFNGIVWRAVEPDLRAAPPPAWTDAADGGGVPAELLVEAEPARLTVTANGHAERYEPAPGATSDCP